MNLAEVVPREVERDRRFVVFQLLLKAFVIRIKRRICIRIVTFCRSTRLVNLRFVGVRADYDIGNARAFRRGMAPLIALWFCVGLQIGS